MEGRVEKECFAQELVDSAKFKECATCPLFEECMGTVYLKGAGLASYFGQAVGLLAGLLLAVAAALSFAEHPAAAGWGVAICLVYMISVFKAGKEYALKNSDEQELLLKKAKAK